MNKEVIPVNEITNFKSRSDEFFPINWYKDMLLHQPIYYHKKRILGIYLNMSMLNRC